MAVAFFNPETKLAHPFTTDRDSLSKALHGVAFGGDPRLLDSLSAALAVPFPGPEYRKVIVLLTAGIEGPSRALENAVVQAAVQKRIALYPVYEHGSGRWSFPGIAKQTGGAAFWLREVHAVDAIMQTIRSPYLVTLSAAGPVKVKGREKTFVSTLPLATQ
jgi:hypothetical protein